jgi:16S rRNA (guanine966-N2)-methyltransferase
VRPTSDRVREALFNILEHGKTGIPLKDARVVDLFAGTGALGLEALSRGASHLTAVEHDRSALAALRSNIETLRLTDRVTISAMDATRLPRASQPCDFAFLDPPYRAGATEPALRMLVERGWLASPAIVVVEHATNEEFETPDPLTAAEMRRYGRTSLTFLHTAG